MSPLTSSSCLRPRRKRACFGSCAPSTWNAGTSPRALGFPQHARTPSLLGWAVPDGSRPKSAPNSASPTNASSAWRDSHRFGVRLFYEPNPPPGLREPAPSPRRPPRLTGQWLSSISGVGRAEWGKPATRSRGLNPIRGWWAILDLNQRPPRCQRGQNAQIGAGGVVSEGYGVRRRASTCPKVVDVDSTVQTVSGCPLSASRGLGAAKMTVAAVQGREVGATRHRTAQ